MANRLRIGILGAAKIAGSFMVGAKLSERVDVVAIGSRDHNRAEQFAGTYGIACACSYEELLANREVDAIYNRCPTACTRSGRSRRCVRASTCCASTRARDLVDFAQVAPMPFARISPSVCADAFGSISAIGTDRNNVEAADGLLVEHGPREDRERDQANHRSMDAPRRGERLSVA